MTEPDAADESLTTPWPNADDSTVDPDPQLRGGPEYARLHAAQRLLQDRLAGAALPGVLSTEVATRLEELCELLAGHQVREWDRYDGWRSDLPGRGHPLIPAFVIDAEDDMSMRGRVTFTRFHLGGGHAVHGGVPPLLFDDVLGRLANRGRPFVARTAYLHIEYRQVTPLDVELGFEARLDRVDGRKRFATGRLLGPDGTVLVEAESLFVQLLPGQP